MIKIYTRNNCPHCDQLNVPQGLNVELIDIDNYDGYLPHQVPALQLEGLNLVGPESINDVLYVMKKAQDGYYKG